MNVKIGPRISIREQIFDPSSTWRPQAVEIRRKPGIKEEYYSRQVRHVLEHYDAYLIPYDVEIFSPLGHKLENISPIIQRKRNEDIDEFLYRTAKLIDQEAKRVDKLMRQSDLEDFNSQLNMIDFEKFRIAQAVFSNGNFQRLWEFFPKEISKIFDDPKGLLESSISLDETPKVFDCAFTGDFEVEEIEALAALIGMRIPMEHEWIRAGSISKKRKFPWGDKMIDESKNPFYTTVVYNKDLQSPDGLLYKVGIGELMKADDGEVVIRGFAIDDHYHEGFRFCQDI